MWAESVEKFERGLDLVAMRPTRDEAEDMLKADPRLTPPDTLEIAPQAEATLPLSAKSRMPTRVPSRAARRRSPRPG